MPSPIPCTIADTYSSIILFADDTGVIINDPDLIKFERNLYINFRIVNEWFTPTFFIEFCQNFYMQLVTKNKSLNKLNIEYINQILIQANFVKFLGISVDNTLPWKQHIDAIIPK